MRPNFSMLCFNAISCPSPFTKLLLQENMKTDLRSERKEKKKTNSANSGCFPPDNLSWSSATSGLDQKPKLWEKKGKNRTKIGSNGTHSLNLTASEKAAYIRYLDIFDSYRFPIDFGNVNIYSKHHLFKCQ